MTNSQASSSVAVVFPGQGSQRPGMGRDFFSQFAVSRDAFVEASDALGVDLAQICFEEDPRLDQTEYTQPCIVTTEIAMMRALCSEFGVAPAYFGGHSLGEYSALCAAGVFSLSDAVRLTRRRGALMQQAVPQGAGAMLAVVSDGIGGRDLRADLMMLGIEIANRNSLDQVVVSGRSDDVARANSHFGAMLASVEHRLVALNVSAPFHCCLMRGIEEAFAEELWRVAPSMVAERAACCTSNVSGGFHEPSITSVIEALTRQISKPVDWVANMQALSSVAGKILEVGPGRPLTGFFRSVGRTATPIISVKHAQKELRAEPLVAQRSPIQSASIC